MKYYAVKSGRKIGVFESWHDCKIQVDGYPNALYKSFRTYDEAFSFVYGKSGANNCNNKEQMYDLSAYIDGSYDNKKNYYSYAGIIFHGNERVNFSFADNDPLIVRHKNIAGEIKAAMYVISYALKQKVKSIEIFYDYAGIENWATKVWKANNDFTKQYVRYIEKVKPMLEIKFSKVKAHSGDKFNEEVDKLAKKALNNITKNQNISSKEKIFNKYKVVGDLKSTKRSLSIGLIIDGKIYPQDYIYKKFKEKWLSQSRMLNEILELKSVYDEDTSKFLFLIYNKDKEWEEFFLYKEDLF